MIVTLLLHKVKTLILLVVNLFRRALCCFRRRRSSLSDSEPLTHVVSGQEGAGDGDTQNWTNEWGEDKLDRRPRTVQDHIDLYRQQSVKRKTDLEEENPEERLNFFEDMTPKITRQTKMLIASDESKSTNVDSRLNFVANNVDFISSGELQEWEETTGWDGDALEKDAQKALREQKRIERERKAWEQHQKRLEKSSRSLGSRVET